MDAEEVADRQMDAEEVVARQMDVEEVADRQMDAEEVADRVHVDPIEIVAPTHGILLRTTFWVATICQRQFMNGRIRRKREVKNCVDFTTL